MWFATHSRMSPANGEDPHWELGGHIEPIGVVVAIQVCAEHNYSTQEVMRLD
jgi:hypothetical protein